MKLPGLRSLESGVFSEAGLGLTFASWSSFGCLTTGLSLSTRVCGGVVGNISDIGWIQYSVSFK